MNEVSTRYALVSQLNYGFRLSPGYVRQDVGYTLKVAGQVREVNDNNYLRIDQPGQTVFFGTHHNGAHYFTVRSVEEGLVDGGETFLHADRTVHPDNSPFSGEIVFPRGEQELKEQFYTGEDRILKNEFVSSANYLSTLARLFPKMGFWFLHPGDGFGRTADWEGMSFDYKGMIVGSRAPGGPTIASIDLDLFAAQNDRAVESALFNRLIGFAKKARIVMVFTSPGFIDALRANLLAQKMADHLVNCR